jgi:hypothetical protein
MRTLLWLLPVLPLVNRRLQAHLRDAVRVAPAEFAGPLTYSAGSWETVSWEAFDLVGVNLYPWRRPPRRRRLDDRRLRRRASGGEARLREERGRAGGAPDELLPL